MLFQIFFFPETYRSLAWSCLHQSEEQLSVAAPGAHLLLPHCCQDGVLERDCQLQQIASCSGERRLEYLPLDELCCLLPQAAPSVLFMAAASLAFARPPLPEALAEPFSTDCCSGFLQTKPEPLPSMAKLLSSLPSSVWCSDFSPSPCCAFPHTQDPFTIPPALAPEPAVPIPCHPVPAFLAPSPQSCIPINMPGLDHVARLSVSCTVLTCFQPDAKLIQPTE